MFRIRWAIVISANDAGNDFGDRPTIIFERQSRWRLRQHAQLDL